MVRLVTGFVALVSVLALQFWAMPVANAADNGGQHLCLLNSISFCADLKDDNFALNQPVYLWSAGTGNGLGWNPSFQGFVCAGGSCGAPWPFQSGSGFNTEYSGFPVYTIEKTQGSSHNGCLGEVSGNVVRRACTGSDSTGTLWVRSDFLNINADSSFTNVLYTDTNGFSGFLTAATNSDGAAMSLQPAFIDWQQWTWN